MPSHAVRVVLKLEIGIVEVLQTRRFKWLGHVLRMREDEIRNANLEFMKADSWK